MHMFFAGLAKGGRSFSVEERQRFIDTVRSEVVFSAHVKRVAHLAPTPSSIVVGISNEPDGGWHQTWRRQLFLSGYCADPGALARLEPTLAMAEDASQIAGRFSVLVVDRLRGSFALATQPARVDSIFTAEDDRFVFFGNQASVLSALRDGVVKYAPSQMVTFLNSGFFAYDDTPYAGVRCVSAFTTIQAASGRVSVKKNCLSTLRKDPSEGRPEASARPAAGTSADESPVLAEQVVPDFVRAFSSLEATGAELGLTGGMDSRLILAGAAAAGLEVESYTCAYGDANRADVWVAQQLARLANVKHYVLDTPRFMLDGAPPFAKLRQTALWTLTATDGMLGCQYPVEPFFLFSPKANLEGIGGEVLRGGYGEHISRPTREQVVSHMKNLWNHSPHLFRADLVAEQERRIQTFLGAFPPSVSPADMLDFLYVDTRCGRWTAAATSASSSRVRPLLDNVVVRHAMRIPRRARRHHLVHRQLLASLLPAAADLPLANKFWHGTPEAERGALRRTWPEAFTEPKLAPGKKGALTTEEVTAIKQYVIDSGRLSLLSDVLRIDEVIRYVSDKAPNDRYYDRFLKSLLSAAVLLSEPWRDLRNTDVKLIPRLGVPTAS